MKRWFLLIALMAMSLPAFAADESGQFFTRGVGAQTCAAFLAEKSKNSPAYYLFRSWANGYLSARSQMTANTYDIAAGMSIERLSASFEATCKANRDQSFWTAAYAVSRALEPKRLRHRSDVITATAGDRTVMLTRDTMREVQQGLRDRGHYRGGLDGWYGPRTRASIEAFQKAQKLPVTGLPDPATRSALRGKAK